MGTPAGDIMAETKESRLSGYYSELNKFIEANNYAKIIKSANKIISERPEEVKAWQCKVVAHIQQTEFDDALTVITKSKQTESLAFEKAYCLYRKNDIHGAWETISIISDPPPQARELKAQILYRLERYDECYDMYRDILRNTSDDFDLERQTNMAAVCVNRATEKTSKDDDVQIDDSSYELLYNGACHLIAVGRTEEALKQLQEAEKTCRQYLTEEEGASEEEVAEEVAIIRVQQGHCLQLLGREREGLAIYNAVLKTKPEDPALLAIINNNLVAINRGGNVFDSRKRMKTATASGLEHKLSSWQRADIQLNHCLLAYSTHQDEVCRSECSALLLGHPRLSLPVTLVQAALVGRSGKASEVRRLLDQLAKDHPQEATTTKLAATQILLQQKKLSDACEVLMSLPENDRYRQGVVSALVVLSTALGNKAGASQVLREAVDWHKKNKTSAVQLGELWHNAADFALRCGDAATAADSLLELRKLNPKDMKTLAQLITAYAQYDVSSAHALSKELPPVGELVEECDPDALEASLGPKYFRKVLQTRGEGSPASPKAQQTPSGEEVQKARKKKKRKTKLPKNYNPEVTPDPERWLPKWQRKGYRKKKDRRNKEPMKGTQGVSSEQQDKFDITKNPGAHAPRAVASPKEEPAGPRKNNPKNKKKGGGKKKGW